MQEKIAVLTSGGDSPGMNAAVMEVARPAAKAGMHLVGIKHGFNGLVGKFANASDNYTILSLDTVLDIADLPGTYLRTARCEEFYKPEYQQKAVKFLKELGVVIALDDFGTGYSSLSQIKHLPIDTLKVDRSFIRNLPHDSDDKAIIEAIIAMGKTLSLNIVAEGVETLEQDHFLREKICDEMQGFYFSKPVAPDQFADLLRQYNFPS